MMAFRICYRFMGHYRGAKNGCCHHVMQNLRALLYDPLLVHEAHQCHALGALDSAKAAFQKRHCAEPSPNDRPPRYQLVTSILVQACPSWSPRNAAQFVLLAQDAGTEAAKMSTKEHKEENMGSQRFGGSERRKPGKTASGSQPGKTEVVPMLMPGTTGWKYMFLHKSRHIAHAQSASGFWEATNIMWMWSKPAVVQLLYSL